MEIVSDYALAYVKPHFKPFYENLNARLRYSLDLQSLYNHKFTKAEINYLSIGCGNGVTTYSIIRKLPHSINLEYVDISPWQLEEFRNEKLESDNIKVLSTKTESFENYEVNKSFEVIESIHSFYGLIEIEYITKLLSFLSSDGIAVVVLDNRENNIFYKLKNYLIENKIATLPSYKYAEDFLLLLDKISGIKYNVTKQNICCDLIFNHKPNYTASSIIDFLSLGTFDWNDAVQKQNLTEFIAGINNPVESLSIVSIKKV